ncbi:MAG: hypothetical protein M3021_12120 [Actinomycetota bacterium]|nr:hypothetical protein [Actinomycetota bacterium]
MRSKLQPWHLGAALILICVAVLGTLYFLRSRSVATPSSMLSCLPRTGAVSLYLDMEGLRRAGIVDLIAGSKAMEDLEYQKFVEGTGFNYRRDLDAVAGAFSGRNSYLVLRGSFDWKRIDAYAIAQGGTCNNSVCRVAASEGRYLSFYPLRSNAMAMAVSSDEWAALSISAHPPAAGLQAPDQPIWLSVSGPALRDVSAVPTGARSFISPLESAENIIMSIGPSDDRLQVHMDVLCDSDTAAADLVTKLEGATNMLRKMLDREKVKPNPRDLSSILTAGNFRREGRRVTGSWPMQRDFVEAVVSGSVN